MKIVALFLTAVLLSGCMELQPEKKCYNGQEYTRWHVMGETKAVTYTLDKDGKPVPCKEWRYE